ENYGPEQEHLNNVFGARLHITGLRTGAGPGIEFLEDLAPRDGKPAPADLRANDVAFWQTTLDTPDAEAAPPRLSAGGVSCASPGSVALPDGSLGFKKGALVRDPDGHPVRLVAP